MGELDAVVATLSKQEESARLVYLKHCTYSDSGPTAERLWSDARDRLDRAVQRALDIASVQVDEAQSQQITDQVLDMLNQAADRVRQQVSS